MTRELRALKRKLLAIHKATEKADIRIKLTAEEIEEFFKEYSREAQEDISNNYRDGYLCWNDLKTETLKEIAFGPILVVGEGSPETVVIIDDISDN